MKIRLRDELRRRLPGPGLLAVATLVVAGTAFALGVGFDANATARTDAIVEQACGLTQPEGESGISTGKIYVSRTVVDKDGTRITVRDIIRVEGKVFLYDDRDEGAPFCTVDLGGNQ